MDTKPSQECYVLPLVTLHISFQITILCQAPISDLCDSDTWGGAERFGLAVRWLARNGRRVDPTVVQMAGETEGEQIF